jgi:hypothetical protein
MLLLRQEFKTLEGVIKRVRFENAHAKGNFRYRYVKADNGMYQIIRYTKTEGNDGSWNNGKND